MKEKQKLDKRAPYTPTDDPRACGNCDLPENRVLKPLNRKGILDVQG